MKKVFITIPTTVALTFVLSGCTTSGDNAAMPAETGNAASGESLVRTSVDQPASFDPTQGTSLPDFILARNSFDTLVRRDDNNELAPGLAEDWDLDSTGGELTLRAGATCSDGTPITAGVVKDSLEYFTDPETASVYGPQVFGPAGNVTFTAVDDQTLQIELAEPWPDMLNGLSLAASGIICPAGLEDLEGLDAGQVEGAESGPYIMSSADHGVRYTYDLRDDYDWWPEYAEPIEDVRPESIEFNVIADKNSTANQLIAGQLDTGAVLPQSIERVENEGSVSVDVKPFSDFYVLFNERESSPFSDPEARRAVAQVLDRETFTDISSQGAGEVAKQMASSTTVCANYDASPVIDLDPEAAADVLDGMKVRIVGAQIIGPNGSGNTYVQEQLREAGADVTLDNLDVGGWISTVYGKPGDWDLTVFADLNFVGSLSNAVSQGIGPALQDGGSNVGATQSEEAEAAFGEYLNSQNKEEACAALNKASDALVADAHMIPLTNDPRPMASREGFTVVTKGEAMDDEHQLIVQ